MRTRELLDSGIRSEFEHGFTHAADHPASLTELNEASREEVRRVLGDIS
jgi:hypothetical protein